MTDPHDTIRQRAATHGDYSVQAPWAQYTKDAIRQTPNWHKLTGAQRESLDTIVTKISRILHGDPQHADSWHDIAGYAALGETSAEAHLARVKGECNCELCRAHP